MYVMYALRSECPIDGYQLHGGAHLRVAVNKRSLRQVGPALTWTDHRCPECGQSTAGQTFAIAGLPTADRDAVEAYRRRRWPDLYGECHWCGASLAVTSRRVLPLHTDTADRRCKGTDRPPMRPVVAACVSDRRIVTAHLPAGEAQ